MQLLAITAMEPPAKFDKNGFRNEVIKVYQSLRPLTDKYIRDNVIRGQYIAGDDRIGYREMCIRDRGCPYLYFPQR